MRGRAAGLGLKSGDEHARGTPAGFFLAKLPFRFTVNPDLFLNSPAVFPGNFSRV